MIKIIATGTKRRVTCPECEAELEYGRDDVESEKVGYNEYISFITCPCCKHKIKRCKF